MQRRNSSPARTALITLCIATCTSVVAEPSSIVGIDHIPTAVRDLDAAGIGFRSTPYFELDDPKLDYLFFVRDKRSPTDKPEHCNHPNKTSGLIGVWIADVESESLVKLMRALGAKMSSAKVHVPRETSATIAELENGAITLLPKSFRHIENRPIVGAVVRRCCYRQVRRTDFGSNSDSALAPANSTSFAWKWRRESPSPAVFHRSPPCSIAGC